MFDFGNASDTQQKSYKTAKKLENMPKKTKVTLKLTEITQKHHYP